MADSKNDNDELQATSPWEVPAPATSANHPVDNWSPQMIGRVDGAEDHNSEATDTETTYQGFGGGS